MSRLSRKLCPKNKEIEFFDSDEILCSFFKTTFYNPLVFLLFSSIISAVDPVAVIAVFDDINVNVTLYIMVFGESLLNDGVAVVLYQVFEQLISMPYPDSLTATNILLVIATFFIIALGGLGVGIIFGYLVSFISKYSHAVPKLELVVMLFIPLQDGFYQCYFMANY